MTCCRCRTRANRWRWIGAHVDQVQNALGRRILIENPATYLRFRDDGMGEVEFLRQLVAASGCGLLLDLNNVHVSAVNHGHDAREYLRGLPLDSVGEIHLAGHARQTDADGRPLLIDSHDAPVDADSVGAVRGLPCTDRPVAHAGRMGQPPARLGGVAR